MRFKILVGTGGRFKQGGNERTVRKQLESQGETTKIAKGSTKTLFHEMRRHLQSTTTEQGGMEVIMM